MQKSEVVALGFIQLDKGAGRQIAWRPVTLLYQKREGGIGGVVVPLAGGDDASRTGSKPATTALPLNFEEPSRGITNWAKSWPWLQT